MGGIGAPTVRVRGEAACAKILPAGCHRALSRRGNPGCQVETVIRPELALVYLEMGLLEDAVAEVRRCR